MNKDEGEKINISDRFPSASSELEKLLDNYLYKYRSLRWQEDINWKNVDVNELNSFYE